MKKVVMLAFLLGAAGLRIGLAPAIAEVDLAGDWAARNHEDYQDRGAGPDMVYYAGIPLSDEARARALSYTTAILAIPQRQCLYYPPYYVLIGPQGIKMWADFDTVTGKITAWNISGVSDRAPLKIWMGDQVEPGPEAFNPASGFSTGKWEGDTLVVHTTHMKEGFFRRNGVPGSDEATMTLYVTRHDDLLSIMGVIKDPIYLTEPYVLSRIWKLNPKQLISPYPGTCMPANELPELANNEVPQYLPGENPFREEVSKRYHLPLDAVLGGAKTLYPEYRKSLKSSGYAPPANYCKSYCCGWSVPAQPNETTLLKCTVGP